MLPDTGAAAQTIRPMLDGKSVNLPWQVTDLNRGQTQLGAYVLGLAESGNTMFVGGKFRSVQHGPGGPKVTQSYLAAFDRDTGEFIPTFNPVINGPVHDLVVTADGKLIVAGEFTSVNGVATTGLAALNTTTGATIPGWSASVSRGDGCRRTCGRIDIQGQWIYVGGYFTKITGGPAATQRADGEPRHGFVSPTASPMAPGVRRSTTTSGTSTPTPAATASTSSARSGR